MQVYFGIIIHVKVYYHLNKYIIHCIWQWRYVDMVILFPN
jgi:hypothetical protein